MSERTYILDPVDIRKVVDQRTGVVVADPQRVLDGGLDELLAGRVRRGRSPPPDGRACKPD